MPIMLGSNHCYLKDMTVRDLTKIRECPYDPRGYFIIKGTEKVMKKFFFNKKNFKSKKKLKLKFFQGGTNARTNV